MINVPNDLSAICPEASGGGISIAGHNKTCQDHYPAQDMIRATAWPALHSQEEYILLCSTCFPFLLNGDYHFVVWRCQEINCLVP